MCLFSKLCREVIFTSKMCLHEIDFVLRLTPCLVNLGVLLSQAVNGSSDSEERSEMD